MQSAALGGSEPGRDLRPAARQAWFAVGLGLGLALALLWGGLAWASRPTTVRLLMPAPFADATAELVESFNREHRGLRIAQ